MFSAALKDKSMNFWPPGPLRTNSTISPFPFACKVRASFRWRRFCLYSNHFLKSSRKENSIRRLFVCLFVCMVIEERSFFTSDRSNKRFGWPNKFNLDTRPTTHATHKVLGTFQHQHIIVTTKNKSCLGLLHDRFACQRSCLLVNIRDLHRAPALRLTPRGKL